MFTGLIEETGEIKKLKEAEGNLEIEVYASFTNELAINQSIAHNGVCLSVAEKTPSTYWVTAVRETLKRSNLGDLKVGSKVNLERSLALGDRLDGHMVQGHVDQVAVCQQINELEGSWEFLFSCPNLDAAMIVEKGSISINGVSLTVASLNQSVFGVAIIPYTYEHTNFCEIQRGDKVNLEWDVIGKYVQRLANKSNN